jgi:hypothetical protein
MPCPTVPRLLPSGGTHDEKGNGMNIRKRAALVFGAGVLTIAMSTAASATVCQPEKCNSGRGNGSETAPGNDCDPGNSGGHNNGGD